MHKLEEAFRQSISHKTPYRQEYAQKNGGPAGAAVQSRRKSDWKYFQMLCAGNNLTRALENQDYPAASRFLYERLDLNGNVIRPWMKVNYTFRQAQIYLGLGEKESAKHCLQYVVSKGNRMWAAREAQRILESMETED